MEIIRNKYIIPSRTYNIINIYRISKLNEIMGPGANTIKQIHSYYDGNNKVST